MKAITTSKKRGQGMTEYIIIVALIAIGTIAVITLFGENIRALFGASTNALNGTSGQAETKSDNTQKRKTLKNASEFN